MVLTVTDGSNVIVLKFQPSSCLSLVALFTVTVATGIEELSNFTSNLYSVPAEAFTVSDSIEKTVPLVAGAM